MGDAGNTQDLAINWFREASPYINAHRGKTMVLCLPGEMLGSDQFATLVHDLTLLSHLGIRLVLSFGLRNRIDARLQEQHETSTVIDGRRVTDDAALSAILTAAGRTRARLEAALSMGLPNTPMDGARLSVCSGNFVSAQPFGIHDGVDYQHTGTIRQVHTRELDALLQSGQLVILPPLGYSITGEMFNLPAEEVATETAIALRADKLVYFVRELPADDSGRQIREASADHMQSMLEGVGDRALRRTLQRAVRACQEGVERVHVLNYQDPNTLLRELFTRDGDGTLVTASHWESIRPATINDLNGIIELIKPLQEDGTLKTRSREELELDIEHFVVCEREGTVIACAALFIDDTGNDRSPDAHRFAEIACVATHPDYRGQGRAEKVVSHLEALAAKAGITRLILMTTRTAHWFIERGYAEDSVHALPESHRSSYSQQRNSKVFIKHCPA